MKAWLFGALALQMLVAGAAWAVVPSTVGLDGRLQSAAGGPVADGEYAVTFALYDASDSKAALWSEQVPKLAVKSGAFAYDLGATKALDQAVLGGSKGVWLGVAVGVEPELPKTPLQSVLFARRAQVAEGLGCTGCVNANHLDPQVLGAYAKSADLANYVQAPDLSAYVKATALAKVAGTGQYADLVGLPVLVKVGTACGTGLVVKGIKADGGLDCGAAILGGKCAAGEVVTEVKTDGAVVCAKPAVKGGKCEPGKVVTEVTGDGGVVCGLGTTLTAGPLGVGLIPNQGFYSTVPLFERIVGSGHHYCGLTKESKHFECWTDQGQGVVPTGWHPGPVRDCAWPTKCIGVNGQLIDGESVFSEEGIPELLGFAPSAKSGQLQCVIDNNMKWRCYGKFTDYGVDGLGPYVSKTVSLKVALPWVKIGLGLNSACGLNQAGELSCIGDLNAGKLAKQPPSGTFIAVSAYRHSYCGVRATGQLDCWGLVPMQGSTPTPLPSGSSFVAVANSDTSICGLTNLGTASCNFGTTNPEFKAPTGALKSIAVYGALFACGIRSSDDRIACGWPLAIPDVPVVELIAGTEEPEIPFCARTATGVVFCLSKYGIVYPPPGPT